MLLSTVRDAFSTCRSLPHERVRFRALVDSEGRVLDVQVTASSGDVEADRTMAEALRKRGFTAATFDGIPIAAWIELKGDK